MRLAASVDENPARATFVGSEDEMASAAARLGEKKDVRTAQGLCLQIDNTPGGKEYQILLRYPLDPKTREKTRERLERIGFMNDEIDLILRDDQSLFGFVYFHEVAHNRLSHGAEDVDNYEARADFWALKALTRFYDKHA